MVNRYLTKNSASLATTKCKIEADLKLHFILVRMAITKKQMTIPAKDLLEEPLFAAGLCYGNYCTMEISMDASQNTEGRTYMSQSCVILGCMPKGFEISIPQRYLLFHIYYCIIHIYYRILHNCQEKEPAKKFISRRMWDMHIMEYFVQL